MEKAWDIVSAIVSLIVPILLALITTRALKIGFGRYEKHRGRQLHIGILHKVTDALVWVMALATIGQQFNGFKSAISALLAQSGLAALGISMAAQQSLQNIIDGIIIQAFKPFNIGDRVTLQEKGLTGIITEMNLRHTVITTYNNTKYIISNSVMSNAIIENSSRNKDVAYPVDVCIAYGQDLELALSLLSSIVGQNNNFIDKRQTQEIEEGKPKVTVLVTGFTNIGINIRATMVQKDIGTSFLACQEVRRELIEMFNKHNIKLADITKSDYTRREE